MKKSTLFLILLACLLCVNTFSFSQTVVHGREIRKATINFTELANYYKLHPSAAVRHAPIEEEDEGRPRRASGDPSREFKYHPPMAARHSYAPLLPVSPAPTDTFLASASDGTTVPPDTHGAVDSSYCVEAINDSFIIQNRSGGYLPSMSLDNFWNSVILAGTNNYAYDPRIHYDPYSKRWITGVLGNPEDASSQVMVGVSVTNDPTGSWYLYSILIDPTGVNWLDFDNVGFNNQWIVICGNLFGITSGASNGAEVYVINKDSVMSGVGAPYTAFIKDSSFSIAPALTYDSGVNDMFMLEDWNNDSGQLQLWKISGPVASPTMTSLGFPTSPVYWQWDAFDFTGTEGADFVPQVGTAHKLQANDARINNCVERNGSVWCSHEIFMPYSTTTNATRTSIMWWQIDTTGPVQQNGIIDDPTNTNFYTFPSIAVNKNSDLLIGYTMCNATIHPYCDYSLHMATDPVDSVRPHVVFRHGLATYYQTFGGGKNRWGDYSGTCVDPKNDTDFWTIQESVPATPANYWDTWWAYVQMCYSLTAAPTASVIPTACTGTSSAYSVMPPEGTVTSFTWAVTGTGWSGTSTTNTINITAGTGVATVSVYANNKCSSSPQFTFTVAPSAFPAQPSITAPFIPCGATAATYTATSAGATSYTWNVLGAGWSGTSSTDILNATVAAGTGTIIATGVNACGTGVSDTITSTVGVGSLPTAPTDSVMPSTPCSGTTALYAVNTVAGATSYTWAYTGAGWSGTSTTNSINLTAGSAAAVVSVTATNSCGTGPAYVFTTTPSLLPGTPVITVPTIPCGTTSGTYTVSSTSATSYVWGVSGTGWSGSSATNTINVTLGTGTGTITCTATNSCGSTTDTITTTAPTATPAAPTAGTTLPTPCIGASATYSVMPSTGASSYNWSISGTGWSGSSTTNAISLVAGTGIATISVTASNGCGTSAAFVFTVAASPSTLPTPSISGSTAPCTSTPTAIYSSSSAGATSYIWNVSGTGWSGSSTTGTITVTLGTGTAMIICTAINACGTSLPDTIIVTPAPGTPASSASVILPSPICSGNYEVFSTPVVAAASGYIWSVAGSGWGGSGTSNTITLTVGTGIATISVSPMNGCGSATPYSITVIPILTPISSFSEQNHITIISAVDTIAFTGTSYLATAFAWSFGGGFASPGTGAGPQAVHWTSPGLKTITLNVSDSGCSSSYADTVLVLTSALNLPELSSKNANFSIVPNPNNGSFDIDFIDNINKPFEVKMIDMAGREVYHNQFNGVSNKKLSIETDGLASGTYIISVIIGNDVEARTLTIRK